MNIDPLIRTGLGLAPFALLLAGCTAVDQGMGDSVKTNIAVQTVEPAPVYSEALASADGAKMAPAVERYRTDKVKQPKGIRTTRIRTGSSGSSGSSQ